jgi:hypothetical protein
MERPDVCTQDWDSWSQEDLQTSKKPRPLGRQERCIKVNFGLSLPLPFLPCWFFPLFKANQNLGGRRSLDGDYPQGPACNPEYVEKGRERMEMKGHK